MRILKTTVATIATLFATFGLVYVVIRYFDAVQIAGAVIGIVVLVVIIAEHWWEKFRS